MAVVQKECANMSAYLVVSCAFAFCVNGGMMPIVLHGFVHARLCHAALLRDVGFNRLASLLFSWFMMCPPINQQCWDADRGRV